MVGDELGERGLEPLDEECRRLRPEQEVPVWHRIDGELPDVQNVDVGAELDRQIERGAERRLG